MSQISMLTLSLAVLAGCASTTPSTDGVIALKSVRGYHVGGERKTLSGLPVKEIRTNPQAPIRKSDPNGDYQVGQLYVQHFALAVAQSNGARAALAWRRAQRRHVGDDS